MDGDADLSWHLAPRIIVHTIALLMLGRDEEQEREERRRRELVERSARTRRAERLAPVIDALRALEVEFRARESVRFVISPDGDSAVIAVLSGSHLPSRAMLLVASFLSAGTKQNVLVEAALPDCLVVWVTDDKAAPFILREKRDNRWKMYTFPDAQVALAAIVKALTEMVAKQQGGLGG